MRATFRALSEWRFRWWITGLFISGVGTWMQTTALDWVVLTELTDHSATSDALVLVTQTGVQLVLLPFAGVVTDRFPRRNVLLATQTMLGLLALALGVLVLSHVATLGLVCLLAGCIGAAQAFDGTARQSFISQLVPAQALANGVALNSATFNLSRLVGPAVAGILIGTLGAGAMFLINAASFAAMLVALSVIGRVPEPRRPRARPSDILGGFQYVIRRPPLVGTLLLVFVVVGSVGGSLNLLVVSTATISLGADSRQYGLLTSAVAVGSVVGALFTAGRARPRMLLALLTAAGMGGALLLAGWLPGYWAFAVCLVLVGFCLMTTMASCNGFVQTSTEDTFRGRVMGLYLAMWMAGVPLGSSILGALADGRGPAAALVAAGIACVGAGAIGIALWIARRRWVGDDASELGVLVPTSTSPREDPEVAREGRVMRRRLPGTLGAEARASRSSRRGSTARR